MPVLLLLGRCKWLVLGQGLTLDCALHAVHFYPLMFTCNLFFLPTFSIVCMTAYNNSYSCNDPVSTYRTVPEDAQQTSSLSIHPCYTGASHSKQVKHEHTSWNTVEHTSRDPSPAFLNHRYLLLMVHQVVLSDGWDTPRAPQDLKHNMTSSGRMLRGQSSSMCFLCAQKALPHPPWAS